MENINCFAYKSDTGCSILENSKGCGMNCPFRKTNEEFDAGRTKALERLAALPEKQKTYINDKYYCGMCNKLKPQKSENHIRCADCRYAVADYHASEYTQRYCKECEFLKGCLFKGTAKICPKQELVWTAYQCVCSKSEYHRALLNVTKNGDMQKRISWRGCEFGEEIPAVDYIAIENVPIDESLFIEDIPNIEDNILNEEIPIENYKSNEGEPNYECSIL